jgi:hypothetical protein
MSKPSGSVKKLASSASALNVPVKKPANRPDSSNPDLKNSERASQIPGKRMVSSSSDLKKLQPVSSSIRLGSSNPDLNVPAKVPAQRLGLSNLDLKKSDTATDKTSSNRFGFSNSSLRVKKAETNPTSSPTKQVNPSSKPRRSTNPSSKLAKPANPTSELTQPVSSGSSGSKSSNPPKKTSAHQKMKV